MRSVHRTDRIGADRTSVGCSKSGVIDENLLVQRESLLWDMSVSEAPSKTHLSIWNHRCNIVHRTSTACSIDVFTLIYRAVPLLEAIRAPVYASVAHPIFLHHIDPPIQSWCLIVVKSSISLWLIPWFSLNGSLESWIVLNTGVCHVIVVRGGESEYEFGRCVRISQVLNCIPPCSGIGLWFCTRIWASAPRVGMQMSDTSDRLPAPVITVKFICNLHS